MTSAVYENDTKITSRGKVPFLYISDTIKCPLPYSLPCINVSLLDGPRLELTGRNLDYKNTTQNENLLWTNTRTLLLLTLVKYLDTINTLYGLIWNLR